MKLPVYIPALVVKYLPATNTKGARIKMTHPQSGRSKVIPFDYNFTSAIDGAAEWLRGMGVQAEEIADLGKGVFALIFPVFEHTALYIIFSK